MRLHYSDITNTTSLKVKKNEMNELKETLLEHKNAVCIFQSIQSIDLLKFLLDFTGPAIVHLTTYSVSERAVNFFAKCKMEKLIKELHVVVDWRIKLSNPQLILHLESVCDSIAFDNYHAKIWLLESSDKKIACSSSINIGHNPRKESASIFFDDAIFQTFKKEFDESA